MFVLPNLSSFLKFISFVHDFSSLCQPGSQLYYFLSLNKLVSYHQWIPPPKTKLFFLDNVGNFEQIEANFIEGEGILRSKFHSFFFVVISCNSFIHSFIHASRQIYIRIQVNTKIQ